MCVPKTEVFRLKNKINGHYQCCHKVTHPIPNTKFCFVLVSSKPCRKWNGNVLFCFRKHGFFFKFLVCTPVVNLKWDTVQSCIKLCSVASYLIQTTGIHKLPTSKSILESCRARMWVLFEGAPYNRYGRFYFY